MSEPTFWERIRIKIAYWLLPWDEPDLLTSLLELKEEMATREDEVAVMEDDIVALVDGIVQAKELAKRVGDNDAVRDFEALLVWERGG